MFSGLPFVARKHLAFMQQSAGLSFHTYYRAFSAHPPSPPFLFLSGGILAVTFWGQVDHFSPLPFPSLPF